MIEYENEIRVMVKAVRRDGEGERGSGDERTKRRWDKAEGKGGGRFSEIRVMMVVIPGKV